MPDEFIRPSGDTTLDGWTDQADGTTTIYTKIDESTAGDSDFVQSPVIDAAQADLVVRLMEGSTEIAEWTHSDISETFADGEQTLSGPELASITDFDDLFIELDDNAGSVYKFALGNPSGALTDPVVVRYRYKKLLVEEGYAGPGDIVASAIAFWGLRAYSAASIGLPVVRIARSDQTAGQGSDFTCLASGDLDTASIATFLGGLDGRIVKFYDQTGNGRHQVADWDIGGAFTSLHLYVPGSLNGKPTTTVSLTASSYATAATITQAQPFSNSMVVKSTAHAFRGAVMDDVAYGGNVSFGQDNVTDQWYMTDNVFSTIRTFTVVNDVWNAVQIAHVSGAPVVKVGSASPNTLATAGTTGIVANVGFTNDGAGGRIFNGSCAELGLWSGAFDSTQMSDLYANQAAYWGL